MKLEQSFEVKAPIDAVWKTLIDIERVAPCLPGAEITDAKDDGTYEGSFKVKLGPTTAAYTGRLSMEDLDESGRRATMKASGRDKRGQGSANATIVSTLHEAGEATRVDVDTDFTITGRLARFGRGGMIEDISNRLLRDFAECLQKRLAGAGAEAPASPESGDVPTPTAGRPPTASPGPAPAATGDPAVKAPGPAAEPTRAPEPHGTPKPARPVSGISLFFSVLAERIKRFFASRRS